MKLYTSLYNVMILFNETNLTIEWTIGKNQKWMK